MYGKNVKIKRDGIEINVWVWCTLNTTKAELRQRALEILKAELLND